MARDWDSWVVSSILGPPTGTPFGTFCTRMPNPPPRGGGGGVACVCPGFSGVPVGPPFFCCALNRARQGGRGAGPTPGPPWMGVGRSLQSASADPDRWPPASVCLRVPPDAPSGGAGLRSSSRTTSPRPMPAATAGPETQGPRSRRGRVGATPLAAVREAPCGTGARVLPPARGG